MPIATKPQQPPQPIQQARWFARFFGAVIFSLVRCYLFKTALSYLKRQYHHINFSYNEIHNENQLGQTWLWQKPHGYSIWVQTLVCKHSQAKIVGKYATHQDKTMVCFSSAN